MKLKLINGNILVRRDEADARVGKERILYAPDNAKEQSTLGTVEDCSPGYHDQKSGRFIEHTVKRGNRVLLSKWLEDVQIAGEKFLVVHETDILAVVEG